MSIPASSSTYGFGPAPWDAWKDGANTAIIVTFTALNPATRTFHLGWKSVGPESGVYLIGEPSPTATLPVSSGTVFSDLSISGTLIGASSPIYQIAVVAASPTSTSTTTTPNSSPSLTSKTLSSTASPTNSQPRPDTSDRPLLQNGVNKGVVIGVAIGCFIAGIFLAGLLACFFKRRRRAHVRDDVSMVSFITNEKGEHSTVASPQTAAAAFPFPTNNDLSQPSEDQTISGEMSKLSNFIRNHVQSYYHMNSVNPGIMDYRHLQALGDDLPISIGILSTLLGNATSRESALRLCIAWVIIARMGLRSPPNISFLPLELSERQELMPPVDSHNKAHKMNFMRWRVSTAALIRSAYVDEAWSNKDSRIQAVHEAMQILVRILEPYASPESDHNGERIFNLEEIVKRAAQFSFTLFSQQSEWDFDWKKEQSLMSGSICIFPSLVETLDESGEPIRPPRPLNEAVIKRLDE